MTYSNFRCLCVLGCYYSCDLTVHTFLFLFIFTFLLLDLYWIRPKILFSEQDLTLFYCITYKIILKLFIIIIIKSSFISALYTKMHYLPSNSSKPSALCSWKDSSCPPCLLKNANKSSQALSSGRLATHSKNQYVCLPFLVLSRRFPLFKVGNYSLTSSVLNVEGLQTNFRRLFLYLDKKALGRYFVRNAKESTYIFMFFIRRNIFFLALKTKIGT